MGVRVGERVDGLVEVSVRVFDIVQDGETVGVRDTE